MKTMPLSIKIINQKQEVYQNRLLFLIIFIYLSIIISMKTLKSYNTYIFISTFTRNIIDVYSVIYLYKLGFPLNDIIAIYTLIYFWGYFISTLSIYIGNKIGNKYILMFSSLITGIAFYILRNSDNRYLIALLLSLSMFTYHPLRHCYGIKLLRNKNEIANTLIYIYIATLLSSYMAIKDLSLISLIIISLISLIPTLFMPKEKTEPLKNHQITHQKLKFFFFDQFRIIFLLLEPLYLYMISKTLTYVGIFNIILTISSVIWIYLLARKIDIQQNYRYLNLLFVIVLLLKMNSYPKISLLIIAFLEGIGIKTNELVSTLNLYDNHNLDIGYIMTSEKFFCITRSLILSIIYFLSTDIKITLYILLGGILLLSFMYNEKNTAT